MLKGLMSEVNELKAELVCMERGMLANVPRI